MNFQTIPIHTVPNAEDTLLYSWNSCERYFEKFNNPDWQDEWTEKFYEDNKKDIYAMADLVGFNRSFVKNM